MTATAHIRGHEVYYDDGWYFVDTGEPVVGEPPCVSCGLTAEPGGPDPCVGWLPGYISYCCGHGVEEPYGIKGNKLTEIHPEQQQVLDDVQEAAVALAEANRRYLTGLVDAGCKALFHATYFGKDYVWLRDPHGKVFLERYYE